MLDDLAERARVAYLVEMDHFIHEKYEFRLLCMRYLASRGWTWFGEELDHRQGERLDAYLQGGDDALLDPIDEDPWYTAGIFAESSKRHPAAAMGAENKRFAQALRRTVPGARYFGFDVGADDTEYLALANAATSYEEVRPAMAYRERLMHERVRDVFDASDGAKIALMAGSLHLMKDDALVDAPGVGAGPGGDTDDSIGHFVAHELADGPVLSIWLLHGTGTSANPWLPPPGTLAPQPDTLDEALLREWTQPCLMTVEPEAEPQRVTQMHNQVMTCRLSDQVDAIIFAPTVTPLRR